MDTRRSDMTYLTPEAKLLLLLLLRKLARE